MNIRLDYHDRTVCYQIESRGKAVSGQSISGLLKAVEESEETIEQIKVSGETKSYTFVRQIYLVANLLGWLSGSRRISFPDYKHKI